jgi:hypothetical protein
MRAWDEPVELMERPKPPLERAEPAASLAEVDVDRRPGTTEDLRDLADRSVRVIVEHHG